MAALLECRNLHKSYRGIRALDGFEVTLTSRTSAGLVGPNGAGKTTLFALLCNTLRADSGSIHIMGKPSGSTQLKGCIGLLPQDCDMLRGITVESQLVFFARLQGFDRRSARLEIARIVELLNIGPLLNQLPETLSHGQRKKIYLAQSLIGKPELLLLDEPTAGLDPAAAEEVRNLTQSLRQQHTLLISSHNLDEIRNICDEIIVINKGRLVRHSRIDELVQHDRCLTLMLDRAPTPELLESITRITGVTSVIPDPERKERLTVHFQQIRPDELQLLLLSELQRNSVAVLEFNRGTALSGKVAELVNQ